MASSRPDFAYNVGFDFCTKQINTVYGYHSGYDIVAYRYIDIPALKEVAVAKIDIGHISHYVFEKLDSFINTF
jgi:hypothetical protein